MSEAAEFNPETATLEELKARANEEQTTDEPKEREEEQTEEQTIYQRRIDLGDGSGVQVFSADSLEGLVDKLTEAQQNATKKIRELNARVPKQVEAKKELNSDEEFTLSQEFMTRPSKAFEKLFQETVGMPITDFRTKLDKVQAFEQAQNANQAATDFVAQTPDYIANPANGKRMQDYLRTYKLEANMDNLTKAYADLSSSGLLEVKDAEAEVEETKVAEAKPEVVKVTEHVRSAPKRSASGLSSRGSAVPTKPAKQGPSEAELYKMPLDQLRDLANAKSFDDF